MTSQRQPFTTPSASPLRVGARLAVLAAVCAALTIGFVAGLGSTSQEAAGQLARVPATCSAPTC